MEIPRHWRLQRQRRELVGAICPRCGTKTISERPVCPGCTTILSPNTEIKISTSPKISVPLA